MTICKTCGVELNDSLRECPLCGTSVADATAKPNMRINVTSTGDDIRVGKSRESLQHVLWQITAVLLTSCIISTVIINLSYKGAITWSIYPVTICLIVLSYASLMALWRKRIVLKIVAGWVTSALILWGVQGSMNAGWPLHLALPIVCAINMVGLVLIYSIARYKLRGLNLIAVAFVAVALFCMIIEGIISFYFDGAIRVQWSVVVAACLLPVTAAILFMYFRTRNDSNLQKIFHT